MDNSLQRAVQKMGNDFLVAAFIPAMGFIIICAITFEEILPEEFTYQSENSAQIFQSSLNLFLFTTILGFTLHTLSTYTYKTFEGYTLTIRKNNLISRSLIRRQKRRFNLLKNEQFRVEKKLARIHDKMGDNSEYFPSNSWRANRYERYCKIEQALQDRRYGLIAECELNFPPSLESIMPTRFGNVLKAAETYATTRYKIDSVHLWGRLSHVIPESGMHKIEQANNQSLFLLNSALLASAYGVLCILASLFKACKWLINPATNGFSYEIALYTSLALLASITAYFFYEASLFNVSQFGDMIRTAYDLYRFNLLEALHLPLPKSLQDEGQTWRGISQFMVGNDAFGEINFFYKHPIKQSQDLLDEVDDEEDE